MKNFDLARGQVVIESSPKLYAPKIGPSVRTTFQESEVFAAKYLKYYRTYPPNTTFRNLSQKNKEYRPLWKRKINKGLWKKVPVVGPHRKYLSVHTNETNLKYFNRRGDRR